VYLFNPLQIRSFVIYSHDYHLKIYHYVFCVDLAQIAVTLLCSVKCLAFVTETECVYCAVRTEYLFGFSNREGVCLLRGTN
jgi:exosortase/archaeosortase